MKRKSRINYTMLALFDEIEFGCIHNHAQDEYAYEVIIMDHENCLIRTLGMTDELTEAKQIAEEHIQNGVTLNGVSFKAQPKFTIQKKVNSHSA